MRGSAVDLRNVSSERNCGNGGARAVIGGNEGISGVSWDATYRRFVKVAVRRSAGCTKLNCARVGRME